MCALRLFRIEKLLMPTNVFLYISRYIPIRTPARKLTATPTPMAGTPAGFFIQTEDKSAKYVDNQPKGNLPFMKPEDAQYFDKLLVDVDEEALSPEEQKERKIMKLLLKVCIILVVLSFAVGRGVLMFFATFPIGKFTK